MGVSTIISAPVMSTHNTRLTFCKYHLLFLANNTADLPSYAVSWEQNVQHK